MENENARQIAEILKLVKELKELVKDSIPKKKK